MSRQLAFAAALILVLAVSAPSRAEVVYLALGDSLTFGIDPSTPSSLVNSFADQGFVKPFADSLASLNGGIRPTVLNLGISGELSTSFFTASPPPGRDTAPQLNRNYPDVSVSQNDRMIESIQSIHAAGNSVGFASFIIGSNDIFYLVGTPAFQNANAADRQAMIGATFAAVQSSYLTVLGELQALAPEAKLILPAYYNPFPTFAPEHAFYDSLISGFDSFVKADAAASGALYVDLAPSFLGNELELTNIGIGDVHPTQAGYTVIASDLSRAAVPEPGSLIMLAIGAAGVLAGLRWRSHPRVDRLASPGIGD